MSQTEILHRLQELEEKFSWQEETVEQLSEVLLDQQKQIEKLETELLRVRSLMDAGGKVANEKPPHY